MDSPHRCPLDRQAFLTSEQPMNLQFCKEIEEHVAANSSDCPHSPLKQLVFDNTSIKGTTPLLLACHDNELDSVKRIVENWAVDVNQAAAFYFHTFENGLQENSNIEKATPLFVAASMGHLDIVRYLVAKGADISARTVNESNADYNALSPLYGAVSKESSRNVEDWDKEREKRSAIIRFLLESGADPVADSVRPSDGNPMWASSLCGSDAITALIEHGMNVNHRYPNLVEITLLNYSIVYKSLEFVEFLVDRSADLHTQDSCGLTPILRAAFYLEWDVFDFLLERNEISRIEKIEALELVGAVILSNTRHTDLFPDGIKYWRQSLCLRRMDTDGQGPIIKSLPENLKKRGRIVEWTNSEELEHVIQHRSDQEIQAFLIQSRILTAKSWGAVEPVYGDYLKWYYTGNCQLGEQSRFVEVLNMLWSMLETIHSHDAREKGLWDTTLDVVDCLIHTLCDKMKRDDPLLNDNTIKTSLKLILATDQYHLNDREFIEDAKLFRSMRSLLNLTTVLAELPHLVNEESMESLSELVQRDQRRCPHLPEAGGSLLHMACGRFLTIDIQHLVVPTIRLLLRAGADPNAGYRHGNGVFHAMAIASLECNIDVSLQESVARLLLDAGAHLDRVNDERKTAADLWMNPNTASGLKRRWGWSYKVTTQKSDLPSWLRDNSVPKLQCECARVIRINGVPYKHLLPPSLHSFVSWH